MNHGFRRLLAGWMISALLAGGAVSAQTPAPSTNASPWDYQITPAQQAALQAYVQGRYRRVKGTVDHDRAQARQYLNEDAWSQYRDEFHPEIAISQFKHCAACMEFGIRVTRVNETGCSVIRLGMDQPGDLSCHTVIEFETQPITPGNAPIRKMASKLNWHPRGAVPVPVGVDMSRAMHEASQSIEITEDERLVQRTPVSACLQQAANGQPCS